MYIDENGAKWFKGNLHMHTQRSDGSLSPEQALMLYKDAGYDFVALTDHYVEGTESNFDGMLVMTGCEFDTGSHATEGIYHIVGIGMEKPTGLSMSPKPDRQRLIDGINNAGGIAFLAHPQWSLNLPSDIKQLHGVCALEIYNTFSGIPWNARPYSGDVLDMLALDGVLYNCTAVDDSHLYEGEQCRSFIMVKAEECSSSAIKAAIRRGDFYSTQGTHFNYSIDGTMLTVHTTPVESVVFFSDSVWVPDRVTCGKAITEAKYELKNSDHYVRFELHDADGGMAWSNPICVNH